MPRFPQVAPRVEQLVGSVYSALTAGRRPPERTFPLHVGDTWLEPPEGCRAEDFDIARYPGMHRYTLTAGLPALRESIAARVAARSGIPTSSGDVLVTAGASAGLYAALGGLVAPGDEVMILAPFWPLIAGATAANGGVPVPVPWIGLVDGPEAAVEQLERHVTPRTAVLYLNTPNNPTGRVIPRDQLEAIVAWARRRDLWVISDEVYEDYVYRGEHTWTRTLAPERTVSAWSFSKAWGMAGNRCGFLAGPAAAIERIGRLTVYTFYCAPHIAQLAALAALDGPGDRWAAEAAGRYRTLGDRAADRLGVARPEGSTFLFVDVSAHLDDRGLGGFLGDALERGLFLAPGPSFGPYPHHVRLCFTSAPPEVVDEGIGVLAGLLGRA